MTRAALLQRLRSRKILIPLIAVLVVAIAGIALAVSRSSNGYRTVDSFVTGTPEPNGAAVKLDTTLYLPDKTPAPAVLLAQGFGGDKSGLASTAQTLAEHGYVVLAYTARGFGDSGGLIHFDSPKYEVHDAELLVDHLQQLPQVEKDKIAVAGSSYGGGLALLLAGYDKRIKAVAADITWNDLQQALFPNGVFKKLWTGTLFGNGFATVDPTVPARPHRRRGRSAHAQAELGVVRALRAGHLRGLPGRRAHRHPERRAAASDARGEPGQRAQPDHRADAAHPGRAGLAVPAQPGRRQRQGHRQERHAGASRLAAGRPRRQLARRRRGNRRDARLVRLGVRRHGQHARSRSSSPSRVRCSRPRADGCASRSGRRRLSRHRRHAADRPRRST